MLTNFHAILPSFTLRNLNWSLAPNLYSLSPVDTSLIHWVYLWLKFNIFGLHLSHTTEYEQTLRPFTSQTCHHQTSSPPLFSLRISRPLAPRKPFPASILAHNSLNHITFSSRSSFFPKNSSYTWFPTFETKKRTSSSKGPQSSLFLEVYTRP